MANFGLRLGDIVTDARKERQFKKKKENLAGCGSTHIEKHT